MTMSIANTDAISCSEASFLAIWWISREDHWRRTWLMTPLPNPEVKTSSRTWRILKIQKDGKSTEDLQSRGNRANRATVYGGERQLRMVIRCYSFVLVLYGFDWKATKTIKNPFVISIIPITHSHFYRGLYLISRQTQMWTAEASQSALKKPRSPKFGQQLSSRYGFGNWKCWVNIPNDS